jgi:hypothetical protein
MCSPSVKRPLGLLGPAADTDALAGGEAVGLDDARAAQRPHVLPRGPEVVEDLEGGRGNGVAGHELLGIGLAALEPGSCCRGAEDSDARSAQAVGDAVRQGHLRADHDQVHVFFSGEADDRRGVVRHDSGEAVGDPGDPVAPGRGDHPFGERAARDLPHERVLTSPRSDHQHLHRALRPFPMLNAGSVGHR